MDKRTILICILILLLIIIFAISFIMQKKIKQDNMLADNIIIIEEKNVVEEEIIETSIGEEKTTPNTVLILKKEYIDCGHVINEKVKLQEEMINLAKDEFIKKYPNWEIEQFSKDEIILSKKLNSFCGEHYLLKEEDGYINIYTVDEQEEISLKEKTNLSVKYLTEVDRINLKNGLMVYGLENLNKLLEDYET